MTKKEILEKIIKCEGGYNAAEPAHVGPSYAGITQVTYDQWRAGKADCPATTRELEGRDDIIQAFYYDYFDKYAVWSVPECLQYIYADFVVNAGSNAVKIIQRLVGVNDDGAIGPATRAAINTFTADFNRRLANDIYADNEVITYFDAEKRKHYERLGAKPEYAEFLSGWIARCNKVFAALEEYFNDEEQNATAVEPEDVADIAARTAALNTPEYNTSSDTINLQNQINNIDAKVDKILEHIASAGFR